MNFLKKLFCGAPGSPEEENKEQKAHDFDVLKYDGVAALKQHNLDYAVKCFMHALELQEDAETHDYLAQALIQLNRLHEAYEQLMFLHRTAPDNVRILLRMADVAYMMEDYDAMTEVCEKAIQLDGDNSMANFAYARARIAKEDFVNAIVLLGKAIAGSSENLFYDAYLLRGQTLLKMGDAVTAEGDADLLLDNIPDNEDVLLLKARCREALDDHDSALETYDCVIDANPFSIDGFKERAALRRAIGDEQGAAEDEAALQELTQEKQTETEAGMKEGDIQEQTERAYKEINPFGI